MLAIIEPGLKGRKQWLYADNDIEAIYTNHAGKKRHCFMGKKGGSERNKRDKYTLEQLRMWAQMIRLGKHDSTDEPPDKPFWRGCKRQQESSQASPPSKRPSVVLSANSPSRKVSIWSELLEQLAKWHNLSECGVVPSGEYEDLKKKILSDIKSCHAKIEHLCTHSRNQ